jgi:hypothetical protein
MVARTVQQYSKAGVAALHIEDQVQTKRCGHLLGKQVVSREEFLVRVRAAVLARDSIPCGSDFVSIRHILFFVLQTHQYHSRLSLLEQILLRFWEWKRQSLDLSWHRMPVLMYVSLRGCEPENYSSQLLPPWPRNPLVISYHIRSILDLIEFLGARECNFGWFDAVFHDR